VVGQLNAALEERPWEYPSETTWRTGIQKKIDENRAATQLMLDSDESPMGYYRPLREIRDLLDDDTIIVSEGASTMDIGRTVLPNFKARHRLDAGSFGTMGVGMAFAIAAQAVHPDKKVVAVEGDSAFGFSGMEVEVALRYGMPITFIIINNNGIGGGPSEHNPEKVHPTSLLPNARYEKVIEAFGGKGFYVEEPSQLKPTLEEALSLNKASVVNIMINPRAQRKPQEFGWLTR
jgi:2-hydroxyacyl-CoA lyase 1